MIAKIKKEAYSNWPENKLPWYLTHSGVIDPTKDNIFEVTEYVEGLSVKVEGLYIDYPNSKDTEPPTKGQQLFMDLSDIEIIEPDENDERPQCECGIYISIADVDSGKAGCDPDGCWSCAECNAGWLSDHLGRANHQFDQAEVSGGWRVCYEQASWNSSDGNIKTYYHVHVQHEKLPEFNSGVGDSNFDRVLVKIREQIIPELEEQLTKGRSKEMN